MHNKQDLYINWPQQVDESKQSSTKETWRKTFNAILNPAVWYTKRTKTNYCTAYPSNNSLTTSTLSIIFTM